LRDISRSATSSSNADLNELTALSAWLSALLCLDVLLYLEKPRSSRNLPDQFVYVGQLLAEFDMLL
jgi:hypothetical protein